MKINMKKILFGIVLLLALLVTVGSALAVSQDLEISNVKVNNIAVVENGVSTAVKPLEQVTVTFKVTNNLNRTITGIKGTLTFDQVVLQSQNTINLEAGTSEELTIIGEVPLNLLENEYPATLSVTGKDINNPQNILSDSFAFKLNVKQDPADVIISKLTLDDSTLSCQKPSTTLKVELTNGGENDENDVKISVTGGNGLSLSKEDITISKNSQRTEQFTIPADKLLAGANLLTVKISYRDDYKKDSDSITIAREDCALSLSATPTESSLVLGKDDTKEFSVTLSNPGGIQPISYKWYVDNEPNPRKEQQGGLESSFTFDASTEGQYTIKVFVNKGSPEEISHPWTVTVSDQPANFEVSEIFFEDVERDATDVTASFTVTNIGNKGMTNVTAVWTIADKYHAQPESLPKTTLAAGEPVELDLQVDVPDNEPAGKHVIGTLKLTGTDEDGNPVTPKTVNIYLEVKSVLAIKNIEVNGKSSGDLLLNEANDVEFSVKNEYTEDLDITAITVTLLDEEDDEVVSKDVDFEDDNDHIGNGQEEEYSVEFDLSGKDIEDEEYTIEITVEGEDDDNNEYTTVETVVVGVERENHQIVIKGAEFLSKQCLDQTATLSVTIENTGESDEDDVEIRVKNNALNLDLKKIGIELEKYSSEDNDYSKEFVIDLADVSDGAYPITVEVYRDGDLETSEDVDLVVSCGTITGSSSEEVKEYGNLAEELQQQLEAYKQSKDGSVVKGSFRESDNYIVLLGILVILMFVAAVLSMALLFVKKR